MIQKIYPFITGLFKPVRRRVYYQVLFYNIPKSIVKDRFYFLRDQFETTFATIFLSGCRWISVKLYRTCVKERSILLGTPRESTSNIEYVKENVRRTLIINTYVDWLNFHNFGTVCFGSVWWVLFRSLTFGVSRGPVFTSNTSPRIHSFSEIKIREERLISSCNNLRLKT